MYKCIVLQSQTREQDQQLPCTMQDHPVLKEKMLHPLLNQYGMRFALQNSICAQLVRCINRNFIWYSGWIICKLTCILVSLLEYNPKPFALFLSSFSLYSLLALTSIVLNRLNQPIGIHLQFLINYAQTSNQYLSQLVTPATHNTSASCCVKCMSMYRACHSE